MKDYDSVISIYQQRIEEFRKALQQVNKKRTRIAWLRFAVVLITIAAVIYGWKDQHAGSLLLEALMGVSVFLFIVSKDMNAKAAAENLQRLIVINEEELAILNGNYTHRESGLSFQPHHHSYASDLDIFGEYSIYQYICRCTSEQGKSLLAKRLLQPLTKEEIEKEQLAVKEASGAIDWRQQLYAGGMESSLTVTTQQRIEAWIKQPTVYHGPLWKWLSIIFPVISVGVVLSYAYDVITASTFYLALFIFFLFASFLSKKIHPVWALLSRITNEAGTIQKQLALIEEQTFTNEKYTALKSSLTGENRMYASAQVKELKSILNRFDVRLNVFAFAILNTFFLWDLQQVLSLNKWKKNNENHIPHWFAAVAETEVLVSIATLSFNKPQWCFPVIADEHFTLEGTNIGHPLIAKEKRVDNDFGIQGRGKVAIITGSNMGGKSTFLRSVGVNMVLAFMGAPVCATIFKVSVVHLMSSMRITDNLAESTSTFYAELKKLQTIIQAVKRKEQIFILLDEILRGTNSLDRHTGSAALIKQLLHYDAVAIIATHDVELANLEKAYPQAIANYHFDVQVAGNDLYFDYKLKHGICQSMNASILMKNIGIEMES
jgi:DNA mismatch repair ATPase MutS